MMDTGKASDVYEQRAIPAGSSFRRHTSAGCKHTDRDRWPRRALNSMHRILKTRGGEGWGSSSATQDLGRWINVRDHKVIQPMPQFGVSRADLLRRTSAIPGRLSLVHSGVGDDRFYRTRHYRLPPSDRLCQGLFGEVPLHELSTASKTKPPDREF